MRSYPEVLRADLQPGAHIQEVWHTLLVQQYVNGHGPARSCIHQVLQDLDVRDNVHDDCYHLEERPSLAL